MNPPKYLPPDTLALLAPEARARYSRWWAERWTAYTRERRYTDAGDGYWANPHHDDHEAIRSWEDRDLAFGDAA